MAQRQQRQANVRLEDDLFEQIEVTAFVHRRSFADEMRAALIAWAALHQADPGVQQASRARDPVSEAVSDEANVTPLNPEGRRRKA